MKFTSPIIPALLLGARSVFANSPIPDSDFTKNNGLAAAEAAAPMWYMPMGTCMPSAAENGHGNKTRGVHNDACNIFKLDHGCPRPPKWQGANTPYVNISGEPFANIPTYYGVKKCGSQWKIVYYVYFKKDTGHRNDWEGIVIDFNDQGGGNWIRHAVAMEQDGHHPRINWSDVNDTFDGPDDWKAFQQKNRNHGKFYFGKFHHSVHQDWHTNTFKDTCPPSSISDYRNADYQFWAKDNLRPISVLDPKWSFGKAVPPTHFDICKY